MSFHEFLQVFILMTVVGTLGVTGWFFITRGEEEVLPDGSIERSGKVFKGWYFFWMQKKRTKKRIYFSGHQFIKLMAEFVDNYQNVIKKVDGNSFIIDPIYANVLAVISVKWDVVFLEKGDDRYSIYKEYEQYVFPWWLRDPLAKCATCFASIYGSIAYWSMVSLCDENLFSWTDSPWIAFFVFWILFCLALAVLNTALAKKFN